MYISKRFTERNCCSFGAVTLCFESLHLVSHFTQRLRMCAMTHSYTDMLYSYAQQDLFMSYTRLESLHHVWCTAFSVCVWMTGNSHMCDMPYSYARQDLFVPCTRVESLRHVWCTPSSVCVCATWLIHYWYVWQDLFFPSREWHDVLMPYIRVESFHPVSHSTRRLCVCGISNSLLVCMTTHWLLISVKWLIHAPHACRKPPSRFALHSVSTYVWHISFSFRMWHDSFVCVTRLIRMCDTTHSLLIHAFTYVWASVSSHTPRSICICAAWLFHMWHGSFITHTCD